MLMNECHVVEIRIRCYADENPGQCGEKSFRRRVIFFHLSNSQLKMCRYGVEIWCVSHHSAHDNVNMSTKKLRYTIYEIILTAKAYGQEICKKK